MSKHNFDKMFSIRVPSKMLKEYLNFSEENDINVSERLRKFMERDLIAWRKKKYKKKNEGVINFEEHKKSLNIEKTEKKKKRKNNLF